MPGFYSRKKFRSKFLQASKLPTQESPCQIKKGAKEAPQPNPINLNDVLAPAASHASLHTTHQSLATALLRRRLLPQPAHALLQFLAQNHRRIRIERHQIPQRLGAVLAQPRQNRRIRMMRQPPQRLRRNFWMLADQPQQIEIFLGSLPR